jgi:CheY-like chemotaxis protein
MKERKHRILVVDDELIIRRLVGDFLKGKGYSVTLAKDGLEALKLAEQKVFDLFLSDLHMPLMEGDVLIKNIKSKPEYKYTPFLFLSGDSNKETWLKNLNLGADDFILKPFDPEILHLKIKANLKKFELRKEIIKSGKRKNLNLEKGGVLFLKNKNSDCRINAGNIIADVYEATDEKMMAEILAVKNIWLIVVDEDAGWFPAQFDKMQDVGAGMIPVTILISSEKGKDNIKRFFEMGVSNFILKFNDVPLIESQINSSLKRENLIKSKYLNAVKIAADNSFIRMEYFVDIFMNHFDINIIHQPFESIPGGDFYEIFTIEGNSKVIVVGDVMGKKWDAWFFVSSYISYIRSLIKLLANQRITDVIHHPSKLLENLNKFIYKDAQLSEVFTTLSVIYLSDSDSVMRISSAGAQKPFFYDGNDVRQLNIIGTLMGIIENVEYEELEMKFESGNKLLLFTDGYNESSNMLTGEMLDNDDVAKSFKAVVMKKGLSARDVENHLILNNHIEKFDDDRTMLLINGKG